MSLSSSSHRIVARSSLPIVLFIVITLWCQLGCQAGSTPAPIKPAVETPTSGGIYRRAFPSGGIDLDPQLIGDTFSHEVCRQMFDGLVEFDAEARVVPALATSWDISPDHLTYTMKLRGDAKFHATSGVDDHATKNKGRLLTADDVSYTFHRLLDPNNKTRRGQLFQFIKGATSFTEGKATTIEGIKILATDSISFTLEKPFSPFLSLLALSNAFIVPREDAEAVSLASAPVGTGPFLWAGDGSGTIVLRANPSYWRGRPFLDRIEFPIIKDEKERFALFKRGALSVVDVPDPQYKNVKADPVWSPLFQETSRWGTYYLGFNITKPPFDNVKVRQAINFAIDRETIVSLILNGRARVARGVLPPGITAYNPGLRGYSYDPPKARRLLAEAGFPDGKGLPELTLEFNRDPSATRTSEFILANLRDVGINCNLKEFEFPEHLKKVESGEAEFFRMGWTVDYPDPDNFLYTLFHSSNIGDKGNFTRYSNPRVDELLDRARYEVDMKDRIPLYQQIEQSVIDEAPGVFIYHYTTHVLAQSNIRGLKITPMGSPFILYREIWLAGNPVAVPGVASEASSQSH